MAVNANVGSGDIIAVVEPTPPIVCLVGNTYSSGGSGGSIYFATIDRIGIPGCAIYAESDKGSNSVLVTTPTSGSIPEGSFVIFGDNQKYFYKVITFLNNGSVSSLTLDPPLIDRVTNGLSVYFSNFEQTKFTQVIEGDGAKLLVENNTLVISSERNELKPAVFLSGNGVPSPTLGEVGYFYIKLDSPILECYLKTSSSSPFWERQPNLENFINGLSKTNTSLIIGGDENVFGRGYSWKYTLTLGESISNQINFDNFPYLNNLGTFSLANFYIQVTSQAFSREKIAKYIASEFESKINQLSDSLKITAIGLDYGVLFINTEVPKTLTSENPPNVNSLTWNSSSPNQYILGFIPSEITSANTGLSNFRFLPNVKRALDKGVYYKNKSSLIAGDNIVFVNDDNKETITISSGGDKNSNSTTFATQIRTVKSRAWVYPPSGLVAVSFGLNSDAGLLDGGYLNGNKAIGTNDILNTSFDYGIKIFQDIRSISNFNTQINFPSFSIDIGTTIVFNNATVFLQFVNANCWLNGLSPEANANIFPLYRNGSANGSYFSPQKYPTLTFQTNTPTVGITRVTVGESIWTANINSGSLANGEDLYIPVMTIDPDVSNLPAVSASNLVAITPGGGINFYLSTLGSNEGISFNSVNAAQSQFTLAVPVVVGNTEVYILGDATGSIFEGSLIRFGFNEGDTYYEVSSISIQGVLTLIVLKTQPNVGYPTGNNIYIYSGSSQGRIISIGSASSNLVGYLDENGNLLLDSIGGGGGGGGSGTVTAITAGTGIGAPLAGNTITQSGTINILPASSSIIGGVRPGAGLSIDSSGTLNIAPPTASVIGGVKAGMNITIASDGTISATGGSPTTNFTSSSIWTGGTSSKNAYTSPSTVNLVGITINLIASSGSGGVTSATISLNGAALSGTYNSTGTWPNLSIVIPSSDLNGNNAEVAANVTIGIQGTFNGSSFNIPTIGNNLTNNQPVPFATTLNVSYSVSSIPYYSSTTTVNYSYTNTSAITVFGGVIIPVLTPLLPKNATSPSGSFSNVDYGGLTISGTVVGNGSAGGGSSSVTLSGSVPAITRYTPAFYVQSSTSTTPTFTISSTSTAGDPSGVTITFPSATSSTQYNWIATTKAANKLFVVTTFGNVPLVSDVSPTSQSISGTVFNIYAITNLTAGQQLQIYIAS